MYISKKKALQKLGMSNTSFFRIQSNFVSKKVGRELFILEESINDYMNIQQEANDYVQIKEIVVPNDIEELIVEIPVDDGLVDEEDSAEDFLYDVLVSLNEDALFNTLRDVKNIEGGGLSRLLQLMMESFEDSDAVVKDMYKKCSRNEFEGLNTKFIELFKLLENKKCEDTITKLGEWI